MLITRHSLHCSWALGCGQFGEDKGQHLSNTTLFITIAQLKSTASPPPKKNITRIPTASWPPLSPTTTTFTYTPPPYGQLTAANLGRTKREASSSCGQLRRPTSRAAKTTWRYKEDQLLEAKHLIRTPTRAHNSYCSTHLRHSMSPTIT